MHRLDFSKLHQQLLRASDTVAPAIQVVVRHRGGVVFDGAYGWLDPEAQRCHVDGDTLFDLASVTKLFVVTACMKLIESQQIALDQVVSTVLPELNGRRTIQPYEDPQRPGEWVTVSDNQETVEASSVTFRHLLTHTSGLPAWRPLYRAGSSEAARQITLTTFFSYPPGTSAIYSDIGLILLGLAIERVSGLPLDGAVKQQVTDPLDLRHTRYLPLACRHSLPTPDNVAPTEFCSWRDRRIVGKVHDENAYRLGGIAGHAGIFSTARDVATFGQSFLEGGTLLSAQTVTEMTRLQTDGLALQRGLGFGLWSQDPEASGYPFSVNAFGHTGFTGTSLWIDPDRELVVALLTNEVYNGRQNRRIGPLRVAVHQTIVEVVDTL